jgi:hypothetical protein
MVTMQASSPQNAVPVASLVVRGSRLLLDLGQRAMAHADDR